MTTFTDEVRQAVSPHKFGNDRRAAAAWLVTLDGCHDEESGDADGFGMWFARVGKTIVATDDQGFVWCERFDHELRAAQRFDALNDEYGTMLDTQEAELELSNDGFQPEHDASLDEFEPGAAVKVEGYDGIAFRVITAPHRKGPDYDWSGMFWVNYSQRVCHMVGDDREYLFDVDELSPLDDDDFCSGCGQIGCGWC